MKKLLATLICVVALASASIPVDAQTRNRRAERTTQVRQYNHRTNGQYDPRYDTQYDPRYDSSVYSNDSYNNQNSSYGDNRSVWDQHRDKITTAGGAVAGALLGGLTGGKKGALIGAIAGGAGAALYTYKIRDKGRIY